MTSEPTRNIGNMAAFELIIEGDWGKETITWHGDIAFDLNLYMEDQTYADLISTHVKRTMNYLKKEVEEIGVAYGLGKPV